MNQKNTDHFVKPHLYEALYLFRYQNGRHDVLCCFFFESSARWRPCVLLHHWVKSSHTTEISVRLRGIVSKNTIMYFMLFKFNPPKIIVRSHGSTLNCLFDTVVNMQSLQCRPVFGFSTAGPRAGTGPWHQLNRVARGFPGICHFSFLSIFHE
jgi:hypothetical protein